LKNDKLGLIKTSLSDDVYELIKDKIQTRRIKPGDRVLLRQFATELGVSITPVQSALRRLETEGLVRASARKGVFVIGLTRKNISDLMDVRILLETYAAKTGLLSPLSKELKSRFVELNSRMESMIHKNEYVDYNEFVEVDTAFHRSIIIASRNEKLLDLYDYNEMQMRIVRFFYITSKKARRVKETQSEHKIICEVMLEGNPDLAVGAITNHLSNTKEAVLKEARLV
jgi:DNA-binding GntR family transcriptional regulator